MWNKKIRRRIKMLFAAGHTFYLCMLRLMACDWDAFYGSLLLPSSSPKILLFNVWKISRICDVLCSLIWCSPRYDKEISLPFFRNKIMMISLSIWKSLSHSCHRHRIWTVEKFIISFFGKRDELKIRGRLRGASVFSSGYLQLRWEYV